MKFDIITLESCNSTNAHLAAMSGIPGGTVVVTPNQTAGRGQRGNSWESEPGANLTCSVLLRPELKPTEQFILSMVVALSVAQTIEERLRLFIPDVDVVVKWPNDIYVGERKIAGILIENRISPSKIDRSIVGLGINLNQREFFSDAPNPVSMIQLTDAHTDVNEFLNQLLAHIDANIEKYLDGIYETLSDDYKARLYRNDGCVYPFELPDGTPLQASIEDVGLDGMLRLSDGNAYAFKEIIWK